MEGIVLFNKPKGMTSASVVSYFRKRTSEKVGHGGTLDPFAEGILILGIGKYTRQLGEFLKGSRKTYIGEIFLGAISDTYDLTGKITFKKSSLPTIEEVNKVLKDFRGEFFQFPPRFSAIKIRGVPAYRLAREEKKFKIKPKKIRIYDLKTLSFQGNILKIQAEVGSGVYIRSLANDLGEKLGCGGYLRSLIRIKISEFSYTQALTFNDLEKNFLEFWAKIYGRVQGVGFRYFTKKMATELGIGGWVKNVNDGTVEVLAQGEEVKLQNLLESLKRGPMLAEVKDLKIIFRKPLDNFDSFCVSS